jgi:hypothetical protein
LIKKYKFHVVIVAVLTITTFATNTYAIGVSGSNNSTPSHHKTYKEVEKPETIKMLEESWKKGKERLAVELNKNNEPGALDLKGIEDWTIIDAGDVDIEFINSLSESEVSSFSNALYSDSRKSYLQYGDRMPGLLLSPEKDHAFLIWERKNGIIVYFELSSSVDDFGDRTWSNGPTIELSINEGAA